jgi:hypothetical protein
MNWKNFIGATLMFVTMGSFPQVAITQSNDDVWWVVVGNTDAKSPYQFVIYCDGDRATAQDVAAALRLLGYEAPHALPTKAMTAQRNAGIIDPGNTIIPLCVVPKL